MSSDRWSSHGVRPVLTVGVLTPHGAAGPEVEIPEMSSGRVAVALERVRPPDADADAPPPSTAHGLLALTRPDTLDEAADRFPDGSVDVIAHASTTTAYALGARAEDELADRLAQRCGLPVVGSGRSAVEALQACGAERVALVHPPWFDDEMDVLGVAYFRAQGLEVALAAVTELPLEPSKVRAGDVVALVSQQLPDECDAVFIAGNGFRAAGAIDELERRTGRTVIEANQALLWSTLGAARMPLTIDGYGRLFRATPTTGR